MWASLGDLNLTFFLNAAILANLLSFFLLKLFFIPLPLVYVKGVARHVGF